MAKMTNQLYYGDNLQVLRDSIATESVDLVYLDPPFNRQANYNALFKAPTGQKSEAQIEAFEDTWHWNNHAEYQRLQWLVLDTITDAGIYPVQYDNLMWRCIERRVP